MTAHDVEAATVRALVLPGRRERMLALLSTKKGRVKLVESLHHFAEFDERSATRVDGPATDIEASLRQLGAPDTCHVMSSDSNIDGRDMLLSEALDAVVWAPEPKGTILCCIPGKLAYFENEDCVRLILHRPQPRRGC